MSPGELICQLCGEAADPRLPCQACKALFYCSSKHRRLHLKMGHSEECHRMSLQLLRAQVWQLPDSTLRSYQL